MNKYQAHPKYFWAVSIMTAGGSFEYLSNKRLVISAVGDAVVQHSKEHPNLTLVQLAARPALASDSLLDTLDS